MLTGGVCTVSELPATSRTANVRTIPKPSSSMTIGLVAPVYSTPDNASLTVNGMLTAPRCQPFASGAGVGLPKVTVGGVASRLTVTLALAVPPDDVAAQVNVTPAVSWVTDAGSQPLSEPVGDCTS